VVQILLAPVFLVFYNLHILGEAWLALVLPLGTWALVANGTFFAALSISSRNRELLLPLILFPIFTPALLAMVNATTGIDLTGDSSTRCCGSSCCWPTTSFSRCLIRFCAQSRRSAAFCAM
jgi:heme exporter protein B